MREQNRGLAEGRVFPSRTGTLMQPSRRFVMPCKRLGRRVVGVQAVRSMTGHVTEEMTEHYSLRVRASEVRASEEGGERGDP